MARGIVGSAFIAVKPDTKGFEAQARVGILGPLKKVAVAAAAAFAAIKVKDFITDAVRGYAQDVNEAYRVTKIFGGAGDIVKRFADSAATSFGLADDEAEHYATQLGQLFVQMGIGPKRAATMSVSMVKLAADMASFANVPVEQAVNALQRGLAGSTRGLKQFGIVLSDAQIKTEAHRLGLIKTVKDGLTPAAKSQALYSLILKQSGLVQGDFDRRSGTLRNTLLRLSAEWDVAKDKIGAAFLPIVVRVAKFLADNLPGAIRVTSAAISGIVEALAPVGDAVGNLVDILQPIAAAAQYGFGQAGLEGAINAAAGALTKMVPQFEPIRSAIATSIDVIQRWKAAFEFKGVEGLLTAIGGRIAILKGDFLDLSTGGKILAGTLVGIGIALAAAFFPVTAIVVSLTALAGALVYAYKTNETFRNAVQAVGAFLQGPALQGIKAFGQSVQEAFQTFAKSDFLKDLQAAVRNVVAVLSTVGAALAKAFGPAVLAVVKNTFEGLKTVVEGSIKVIQGVINIVVGLLSGDWSRAWQGAKQVVSGALSVISGTVKTILGNVVIEAKALATAAGSAIGAGLKAGAGAVGGAVSSIAGTIGSKAGAFLAKGAELAQRLADGILQAPKKLLQLHVQLAATVSGAIVEAANAAYTEATQLGSRIVSGVVAGLAGLGAAVKNKVQSTLSSVLSHIDIPGFSPPEHAGAEAIGKPLGRGVLLGYLEGTRDLPDKIKESLRNAIDRAKTVVDAQRESLTTAFEAMADKAFTAFDARTTQHLDQIAKRFDTLRAKADAGLAKSGDALKAAFDAKMKGVDDALAATNTAIDTQLSQATDRWNRWQHDSDAATDAWAKGQTDAINSALQATLAGIEAWQKELTPTEALIAQQQASHDAAQAAQQLADAQQAVADAKGKLNAAQGSGDDPQAIIDAQKALGDAQRQLAEVQFQQQVAQEQQQAQAERAQRDVDAEAQKTQAQAQAQAQIDQVNAQAQAQRDANAANAAAQIAQATAIADAARAQAQVDHDKDAAAQQAQYDAAQARLEATHDKRIAALDRQQAREQLEYQADRDLLKEHLQKRLAAIERATVREENGWKTHHAAILKLFGDITGDYKTAGRNLGSAFVQGMRESQGELEGMAQKLAQAIANYLKLHSPAKKGPLSTLDTWWKQFTPTLMKGLDTAPLRAATSGLGPGRIGSPGAGSYGALGDPRVLRKLDEVVAAVREHRDGDLTVITARGGVDLNEIAARAGG